MDAGGKLAPVRSQAGIEVGWLERTGGTGASTGGVMRRTLSHSAVRVSLHNIKRCLGGLPMISQIVPTLPVSFTLIWCPSITVASIFAIRLCAGQSRQATNQEEEEGKNKSPQVAHAGNILSYTVLDQLGASLKSLATWKAIPLSDNRAGHRRADAGL